MTGTPDNTLTLVTGFGRCGTSLVMQMLQAGDVPVAGTWPAFEPPETSPLAFDVEWLGRQRGRAVKVIDPQLDMVTFPAVPARSIWIDRDHKQQTQSAEKFSTFLMPEIIWTRRRRLVWRAQYKIDRRPALAKLQRLGPVLVVQFEDLINRPYDTATRISEFIGAGEPAAMAAEVIPRSPDCLPYLLELEFLKELQPHE